MDGIIRTIVQNVVFNATMILFQNELVPWRADLVSDEDVGLVQQCPRSSISTRAIIPVIFVSRVFKSFVVFL